MKRNTLHSGVLAPCLVLLATVEATADGPYRYQYRGDSANAYVGTYDGCAWTEFYVNASEGWEKGGPGAPTRGNGLVAYFYKADYCTGIWTEGYTQLDGIPISRTTDALSIGPLAFMAYQYTCANECNAECNGGPEPCTPECVYYTCRPQEPGTLVTASLNLSATGAEYRGTSHTTYRVGRDFFQSQSNGIQRPATVEAAVTLGDGEQLEFDFGWGEFGTARSGSLQVIRP